MHAILIWLEQNPKTWVPILMSAYSLLEWALPRVKSVRARSVLEGIANVAGIVIPWIAKKFGTPLTVIPSPPADPDAPPVAHPKGS